LIQIASPLAFSIAGQFVIIAGEIPNIFQVLRRCKLIEPKPEFFGTNAAQFLEHYWVVIRQFFEFLSAKTDFQDKDNYFLINSKCKLKN